MSDLLGLLLPLGIGAAISPVPTATCLMLLSTNRRPLATAIAFLIGSSAVLVAVGVLSLSFFGGGGTGDVGRHSDIKDTIDVTFGGLFLVLAFKLWLRAPDPNAPPPSWLAAVGSVGMVKAFLFGTVTTVTNFSSLPLYLSGLKEIVTANIGIADGIIALALFILLIEAALLAPITSYALAPRRRRPGIHAPVDREEQPGYQHLRLRDLRSPALDQGRRGVLRVALDGREGRRLVLLNLRRRQGRGPRIRPYPGRLRGGARRQRGDSNSEPEPGPLLRPQTSDFARRFRTCVAAAINLPGSATRDQGEVACNIDNSDAPACSSPA